jgi:plastocyanin
MKRPSVRLNTIVTCLLTVAAVAALALPGCSTAPSGHAPAVHAITDQTVKVGAAITVTAIGGDQDGDTITWTATGMPAGASLNPTTGVITYTGVSADAGSNFTITVTARDPSGLTGSATFTLSVPGNHAPTVQAVTTQTVSADAAITITPVGTDPDGDTISWTATGMPATASLNSATGVITYTGLGADAGSNFAITLTAQDSGGLTGSTTFTLSVQAASGASVVTISGFAFVPASLTVSTGTSVTWTNNDAATHTVTSTNGPSFDSGNMGQSGQFSLTFNNVGTFTYHCNIHPGMTGTIIVH